MTSAVTQVASDNIVPITPSQLPVQLHMHENTGLSLFIWGQPGIAKSKIVEGYATSTNRAFIDVRVGQIEPADLRGVPYPVNGGKDGIRWSAPMVLPRNINENKVIEIEAIDHVVEYYNPLAINGIRYCKKPTIVVKALNSAHKAIIVSKEEYLADMGDDIEEVPSSQTSVTDTFVVRLVDADGNRVAGKVHYRVVGKTEAILALEEFNSGNASVQGAAYELVLDRRQGEYLVPEGVRIIALGNREGDKGVTSRQPLPIANRFTHYELQSHTPDWLLWAIEANIHPQVVGYISAMDSHLNQFNSAAASKGFATPRSWEMVSRYLWANPHASNEDIAIGVNGMIGVNMGALFCKFRAVSAELPRSEDILSGKIKKADKMKEPQLALTLATNLCYKLREEVNLIANNNPTVNNLRKLRTPEYDEFLKRCDNFFDFAMKNFTPEVAMVAGRTALKTMNLPMATERMDAFEKYAIEFSQLFRQDRDE